MAITKWAYSRQLSASCEEMLRAGTALPPYRPPGKATLSRDVP